jgi:hypothetical protein
MYFWRDRYFQTVKEVAVEAGDTPQWADYAAFCTEKERGLRQQAMSLLNRFISSLEGAPFPERRRFVSWLLDKTDGREGQHMLVPHPLFKRVIEPTLLEWTSTEPACSEPHRWLGGYEHLKHALELDPADELARRKFIACILGKVGFSTHELPFGYLGVPEKDLAALDEAEAALSRLPSDETRQCFDAEIAQVRKLIDDYLLKGKEAV